MAPATSSGHTTRLLLEELSALLDIGPVVDITGEEKELHPDDVCDGGSSVRAVPGVLIVRHRLGMIGANAGIDQSNVDHRDGECALLLPVDPDRSAAALRESLQQRTRKQLGVIISDSNNRPWRLGTLGQAIGSAGIRVLDDRRGQRDLFGRELQVTVSNRADSIATAALMVMGETTERVPAALVQGLEPEDSRQVARDSLRPAAEDLFL